MPQALADDLATYGVAAGSILDLRQAPDPQLMRYLDLLATEDSGPGPRAVIEAQRQPLAFLIDGLTGSHPSPEELLGIRRRLSFRGDAPYMALLQPGQLTVYRLGLDSNDLSAAVVEDFVADSSSSMGVFQTLAMSAQEPQPSPAPAKAVHDLLFGLLSNTIDGLCGSSVGQQDALSLAGRALFMRFLVDRRILTDSQWSLACPGCHDPREFFADAQHAEATCRWLDTTFNGDFLRMSMEYGSPSWNGLGQTTWDYLSDVMNRSRQPLSGQLTLGVWSDIDFAYVPVGVLSEVYEHQAEAWEPERRRREAQYYTPRRLAEHMVAEAFGGLVERGPCLPADARVLDPAVGAGVFLTAALRELVAAEWRATGRPPDTTGIRRILYGQLTGLDINESALRLASLSLYLTAIELDPYPHPVESLRFDCLRGTVLRLVSGDSDSAPVVGSLGTAVGEEHSGKYDIVVGNPPWTSLPASGSSAYHEMLEVIRPIVAGRLGPERASAFEIADLDPDVPFFWRSLDWVRADGWIALLMHARLLFKQTAAGRTTREDVFAAAEVTGVLNGADLAGTGVWPNVNAPFCMLFARNRVPARDYPFLFVSPYVEPAVNKQGRLRIDALDAHPVSSGAMARSPHLLKTLFRGTSIDHSVLDRVKAGANTTIGQYWRDLGLSAGEGYQLGNPDQRSRSASELCGLPEIRPADARDGLGLIVDGLRRRFSHPRVQWPRERKRYAAPLLLVPESLRLTSALPRAHIADGDLVFNESFRGYSAAGHPHGRELVRYLALIVHSRLYAWHALLTSGKFGVERRIVQGRDIDAVPCVPLEELSGSLRADIPRLLSEVSDSPGKSWEITDAWMSELYGLDRWELEAMRDCVDSNLPFDAWRKRAARAPTRRQVEAFAGTLTSMLTDAGCRCSTASVISHGGGWSMPWVVIDIVDPHSPRQQEACDAIYQRADELGASRVFLPRGDAGGMRLAVLRESRYWTPTRARLTALTLLNEHSDSLGLEQ